ncbi:MAG: 16S rRNA (guanine(527)-N(7))-methyltransferase RsmG [Clostridia bacterium]|nr:16S rRNA (guanine(527)-N(7))-methyltransferase RsmG [Clostridia bacterium]
MKNLKTIFEKYGIGLDELQEKNFCRYFNHMVETNKFLNLTAITEEDEVVVKHFLDSVLPKNLFKDGATVIDVGSGAGFPALPLKIVRNDLQICMLDSLNKRVNFLNEVVEKLRLKNIFAVHSRAEDYAKTKRESFDVATARAVASLDTLVEYLLPFVKIGGCAIIYKAAKLAEELGLAKKAIEILGGKIDKIVNFKIEENDIERNVLVIKKIKQTPVKYPRGKNLPKTTPIK